MEEKFLALRQEGSVRDYQRWFETLASPLDEMPEAILEGKFYQWAEARNPGRSPSDETQRVVPKASSAGKPPNQPFKRLSKAELQIKREKGLCFRCDEKYTIGHRCKNKELQVLLVQEGGEWEVDEREEGEGKAEEVDEVGEVVELSLNSVVGLTPPRTMKVRGRILSQDIVILIDCGASHNFISSKLVQILGLLRIATTGYGVIMGTGLAVQGAGVCKGVAVEIQRVKIKEDFLSLELGSSDVILGRGGKIAHRLAGSAYKNSAQLGLRLVEPRARAEAELRKKKGPSSLGSAKK
ncbi:Eukaryotic aspartyl protease family protein [Abeliophyllum distichum]|uniref:Eukaryotic aspartyl protease family protein n=1 Tax=Abeliophyllum distichum TaxID=126358 RepID=A0ABD1PV32_9LAMI